MSLAREFAAASSSLTPEAFDANGRGILEKVFEIGCALTDVVSVRPERRASMEVGPQEYLGEMLRVLSVTKSGHKYRGLLMNKAEECFGDGLMVIGHLNRAVTIHSTDEQRVTRVGIDDENRGEVGLVPSTEPDNANPPNGTSETLFHETWTIGGDETALEAVSAATEGVSMDVVGADEEMYDFGNLGNVSAAWLESLGSMGGEVAVSPVEVHPTAAPHHGYYM